MDFKYAFCRIIIQNSIEPSKTRNCTSFQESLDESNGLIKFSTKQREHSPQVHIKPNDPDTVNVERMLIHSNDEFPNVPRDTILYYFDGYFIKNFCKIYSVLTAKLSSFPILQIQKVSMCHHTHCL